MVKNKPKVVTLVSGGIDSSVLVLMLRKEGFDMFPLFIDYGQLATKYEFKAVSGICKYLEIKSPKVIDIRSVGKLSLNQLTNAYSKDPWFPHRNLLLLTIAAMYAKNIGCYALAYGIVRTAGLMFPDCSNEFTQRLSTVLSISLGDTIKVYAPTQDFAKFELVAYAASMKFPLSITYSCFKGKKSHCGRCQACKNRKEAFKLAKVEDTTNYVISK